MAVVMLSILPILSGELTFDNDAYISAQQPIPNDQKTDLSDSFEGKRKNSLIQKTFTMDFGIERSEHTDDIPAVDSDYFLLYKNDSLLPIDSAGTGVHAKHLIPKDTIICEYRGTIIESDDIRKLDDNMIDKAYNIVGPDGLGYQILGEGVCAFINDCTSAMAHQYTIDEWRTLTDSATITNVPCFEGFEYNAVALSQPNGKMFIVGKSCDHSLTI